MVMGYWMGGLPGAYWWRRLEMSGGQIVEQTTHIFDLARYLVGDIVRVSAATALRALHDVPDLNVPDVGVVNVWFANGAIDCIANTCMLKLGYTTGLHILTPDLITEITWGSVKFLEPHRTEEVRHQRKRALLRKCRLRGSRADEKSVAHPQRLRRCRENARRHPCGVGIRRQGRDARRSAVGVTEGQTALRWQCGAQRVGCPFY
jgi:predicted dehydrogenase